MVVGGGAGNGSLRSGSFADTTEANIITETGVEVANKRPPLCRITVSGERDMQYVATARLRGTVTVKKGDLSFQKVWAQGPGFDLLFDKEQVQAIEILREVS